MPTVGIQADGESPKYTKDMAMAALRSVHNPTHLGIVADIGGGKGELSEHLASFCREVWLVDYAAIEHAALPVNVLPVQADLNKPWPLPSRRFEFVFSLECIEHIENPRHFMREIRRITIPNGYIFVSTPNNLSITSKVVFFLRGQHRLFQEPSYPAHITPMLKCDFERIAQECNLKICDVFYSNTDTIPVLHWRFHIAGVAFSDTIGFLFQRVEGAIA